MWEVLTSDYLPIQCSFFFFLSFSFLLSLHCLPMPCFPLCSIPFHFSVRWFFTSGNASSFHFLSRANLKSVTTVYGAIWVSIWHFFWWLCHIQYLTQVHVCVIKCFIFNFLHWCVENNSGCINTFLLYLSAIRLEEKHVHTFFNWVANWSKRRYCNMKCLLS